jgi:hypothetical protein
MAVFDHLKRPQIAFTQQEQKDGSLASDYKLNDSDAVLNIKTRLQLQFFLAGEVEGVLDAHAELQQQSLSLALSAPLLFFRDLTVGIRYYFAGLLKDIYQRLINWGTLSSHYGRHKRSAYSTHGLFQDKSS